MNKRLLKLFISLFLYLTDSIKRTIMIMAGKKIPATCVVLYYHAINSEHRELFVRQMDTLLRLTRPLAAHNNVPLTADGFYVAITFDDAFTCILDNAVPALLNRNIPFTVFVPTGFMGKKPGWIKENKSKNCQYAVLNDNQIIELKNMANVFVGSHCVSHRNLNILSDVEARKEIFQSKAALEGILGERITTLSFPHGAFNQQHIIMAQEAGYERVFSISPSLAFSKPDEYITGRVNVDPDDWMLEFRLKICGTYRWLPLAFAAKKALRNF